MLDNTSMTSPKFEALYDDWPYREFMHVHCILLRFVMIPLHRAYSCYELRFITSRDETLHFQWAIDVARNNLAGTSSIPGNRKLNQFVAPFYGYGRSTFGTNTALQSLIIASSIHSGVIFGERRLRYFYLQIYLISMNFPLRKEDEKDGSLISSSRWQIANAITTEALLPSTRSLSKLWHTRTNSARRTRNLKCLQPWCSSVTWNVFCTNPLAWSRWIHYLLWIIRRAVKEQGRVQIFRSVFKSIKELTSICTWTMLLDKPLNSRSFITIRYVEKIWRG